MVFHACVDNLPPSCFTTPTPTHPQGAPIDVIHHTLGDSPPRLLPPTYCVVPLYPATYCPLHRVPQLPPQMYSPPPADAALPVATPPIPWHLRCMGWIRLRCPWCEGMQLWFQRLRQVKGLRPFQGQWSCTWFVGEEVGRIGCVELFFEVSLNVPAVSLLLQLILMYIHQY